MHHAQTRRQNPIRLLAVFILIGTALQGCSSPGKKTATGAGIGAAGGAGAGAIIGGGRGALIGAGIGAALGGAVGNRLDKQAKELAQVAETQRTRDGILVNLKNDLLFDTGSANLKGQAEGQLSELSSILAKYPTNRIQVAGHTDSTGTMSGNQNLSVNRANSVRDILLQNGVGTNQIVTTGYGQSRPIATNSTPVGRSKNRRVELHITDTEATARQ
jgi:outer membrane protein OmpA-like peptidoglycan-associated protein